MSSIISQLVNQLPRLGDFSDDGWALHLRHELSHALDGSVFVQNPGPGYVPLYEGKMIRAFECDFDPQDPGGPPPRFWVDMVRVGERSNKSKGAKILSLAIDESRLALRAIAASTDRRTLIASLLPPRVLCGRSLLAEDVTTSQLDTQTRLYLLAILNAIVADYWVRSMRPARAVNVTLSLIEHIPVPRPSKRGRWFSALVKRTAQLACTTASFQAVASELGIQGIKDPVVRQRLRAELDGLVAHLYGLKEDDFVQILKTFPLVPEPEIVAAHNAYRDVARGLIP